MRFPQCGDHALVQEEDQRGVQRRLEQVEGDQQRQEHLEHRFPRCTHEDRGHDVVPQQHDDQHRQRARYQSDDRAREGLFTVIDDRAHADEHARGEEVHQQPDPSGGADGDHLDQTDDQRHEDARDGSEDEAADGEDDVLGLVGQKAPDPRYPEEGVRRNRQRDQHRHREQRSEVLA